MDSCPAEGAVVLSEEACFDAPHHVLIDQKVCRLIHAEPDQLWLDTEVAVPAGAVAQQDTLLGSLKDLFRVFGREWGRRWSKHLDVGADWWRTAVESAFLAEPVPEAEFPDITPDLWRTEVRRRKASSASGLDGITRQDLLLFCSWMFFSTTKLVGNGPSRPRRRLFLHSRSVRTLLMLSISDQSQS